MLAAAHGIAAPRQAPPLRRATRSRRRAHAKRDLLQREPEVVLDQAGIPRLPASFLQLLPPVVGREHLEHAHPAPTPPPNSTRRPPFAGAACRSHRAL